LGAASCAIAAVGANAANTVQAKKPLFTLPPSR